MGVQRLAFAEGAEKGAKGRFQSLPDSLKEQIYTPKVPYPGWDTNWDYGKLSTERDVRKALELDKLSGEEDMKETIRSLYAEAGARHKEPARVEELIEEKGEDLLPLLLKAVKDVRGRNRHIIFVRHGQYVQGTKVASEKVLTPLGRLQAEKTGRRLAELLKPVLTAPSPEKRVRVHASTMVRAEETAKLIAGQLPAGTFETVPSTPLLVEGSPPAHNIPEPLYNGKKVNRSLMEAGFRQLFRRLPPAPTEGPLDEFEVVVCHANVIRFMVLRALQLPPEAWFRVHPNNCSITHLKIRADGEVNLFTFGNAGHLSPEENTFNMTSGYPFPKH